MHAPTFVLPLILFMSLAVVACDAGDDGKAATKPSTGPVNMKINIKLPDKTLTATLADSPTARDFALTLPLTLTLKDYAKTEKVADLPKKLTTEGAPAGADPSAGDIAYYAPWGNLADYYKDFGYLDGLILLGTLDGGTDALSGPGPLKVTIELNGGDDPKRSK